MTAAAMMKSGSDVKSEVMDVLKVIEGFSTLLKKETDALKSADFKTVDGLQTDKKIFAKQYHAVVTGLSTRKDDIVKLDIPVRERLIRARTDFTIILNDNLRALEMAKDGTKRLVNRILDAARQAVAEDHQTGYSAKGQMQSYKSSTTRLSVDQKL